LLVPKNQISSDPTTPPRKKRRMEHLSSATVNAIVKQIKDLQKNPAEGITVRFLVLSLFLFSYSIDRFVVVYGGGG
jgi:hypothetical protein